MQHSQGALPPSVASRINGHVAECSDCSEVLGRNSALAGPSQLMSNWMPFVSRDDATLERSIDALGALLESEGYSHPVAGNPGGFQDLRRLRDYQLVKRLGQGGMGAVFKAQHEKLGKTVAIKLMSPALLQCAQARARFNREMQAIGALEHANVVRASDAGNVNGIEYLVMEYVDGPSFAEIVGRRDVPIADCCELIRQAAQGLEYVHSQGMVHRDIKPSNLLLDRQGAVKIADLGLALVSQLNANEGALTQTGQVMGTPDYLAPEQCDDTHHVDARADIYSLGATLFTLLAGQAPFDDDRYDSLSKKLMAITTKSPPHVRKFRPETPRELERIVQKMMARNPADRYASAGEVAEALAGWCGEADLPQLADCRGIPQGHDFFSDSRTRPASRSETVQSRSVLRFLLASARFAAVLLLAAGLLAGLLWATGWRPANWPRSNDLELAVPPTDPEIAALGRLSRDGRGVSPASAGDASPADASAAHARARDPDRQPQPALLTSGTSPGGRKSARKSVANGTANTEQLAPASAAETQAETSDGPASEHEAVQAVALAGIAAADSTTSASASSAPQSASSVESHPSRDAMRKDEPGGRQVAFDSEAPATSAPFRTPPPGGRRGDVPRFPPFFGGRPPFPPLGLNLEGRNGPAPLKPLLLHTNVDHRCLLFATTFCGDGAYATAGYDQVIRLWARNDHSLIDKFAGHQSRVTCLAYSVPQRMLVSGSYDKTVRLWGLRNGRDQVTLRGHQGLVTSVAVSGRGEIASASYDQTVRIWDLLEGGVKHTLSAHKGIVRSVDFSIGGQRLASGGADKVVRLWSVADGRLLGEWRGHRAAIHRVKFSPCGRVLCTADAEGAIRIWAPDGQLLRVLAAHEGIVHDLTYSPDGGVLLSVGADGRLCAWRVGSGSRIVSLEAHKTQVRGVALSDKGGLVVTVGHDMQVKLWRAPFAARIKRRRIFRN